VGKKRHLPKLISTAEADRLMEAAGRGPDGVRNRLLLELMYRAGLRVGETVSITIRDVQEPGIIRIYDGKGGDGTAYYDPERIGPLLDAWIAERGIEPGTLLRNVDGSPLTVRYVQRLVKRLKVEVGIAGICTPHVLRHTYATELLREGFDIREVQRSLRHANIGTTEIYTHVEDDALRRKMARRSEGSGNGSMD
jgi:site-specific recombinase XerD